MKFAFVLPLLLACGGHAREKGDHPIESVIFLLEELRGKVVQEGNDEATTYGEFKKWCTDSLETLDAAIKDSEETISSLEDTVESKKKDKEALEAHIKFLEDEITKYEGETSTAKEDREKQAKAYEAADKDFESTIKAIDEALTELIASKKAALVQFMKPEDMRQEKLLHLLQQPMILAQLSDADRDALTAAVHAGAKKPVTEEDILAKEEYAKNNPGQSYTFKSGGIIEMLQGLKTHFENEKMEATKAETAAANEYEANYEAAKDALEAAKTAKEAKTTQLGETEKDLSTAESDLKDEKDELEADKKTRDDTKTSCDLKHSQFLERKKLRAHEVAAMEAAMEILAEVSGVRTKTPENPTPPAAPVTKLFFLQLNDPKMKAVTLLRQQAREMHSHVLQQFAEQLAAHMDSPFHEVNGMIEKMIFRLMAEQTSEDKHKAWCDLEVNTTERSKVNKEQKLKSLDAKIADGKATVDELTIKIKDLDEGGETYRIHNRGD
jgi:predicted  nucleic acid-binding Zn-ribbon protein